LQQALLLAKQLAVFAQLNFCLHDREVNRCRSMTNGNIAQRWQLVELGSEAEELLLKRAGHSATVVGKKVYVFG
jgi:hypothetical protein